MKTLLLALAAAATLALTGPAAANNPGSRAVSDDPSERPASPLFEAGGFSHVEAYRGATAAAAASDRVRLVGALQLDPFNLEAHGDVAGYKNLAFVGKWRGECPGTGVDIIDIRRPRAPVKLSDTLDYADTSMEDMQAIRIGNRDILSIGLQDCGLSATDGAVGLELYDITDPRNPQFLSLFNGEDYPPIFATPTDAAHGHVHELDVARLPDGRTVAALSSPDSEAITSDANAVNGVGDLILVDISDPANPTFLGEYGVLDDPLFGVPFYLSVLQGGDARTLLHSPRFNKAGTRLYLSYWDAGVIILDISDPENPTVLGRTAYDVGVEGNAHSTATARQERLLIQADEDFSPFETVFSITDGPNAGPYPGQEGAFTVPIVSLADKSMNGSSTFIGLACPGDPAAPPAPDDGDPLTEEIAVAIRGVCFFQDKATAAEAAGYDGFIVMNDAARGDALVLMGGSGVEPVPQLPGIFVGHSTGLRIFNVADAAGLTIGMTGASTASTAQFNGWGYLRFFNTSDPANPVQLSTFATPNTNNEAVALDGTWSVHNPEVFRTNTLYASWYSDGVRVLNISRPRRPREVASWTGQGAPAGAPPVNIWSVVPHRGLLLVSDRNFGLYILRDRGAG
ncbi:MAG: PA domain-containing protein [Gaiellaceae bacterium]